MDIERFKVIEFLELDLYKVNDKKRNMWLGY